MTDSGFGPSFTPGRPVRRRLAGAASRRLHRRIGPRHVAGGTGIGAVRASITLTKRQIVANLPIIDGVAPFMQLYADGRTDQIALCDIELVGQLPQFGVFSRRQIN